MDELPLKDILSRYGVAPREGAGAEVIESGNTVAVVDTDAGRLVVRRSHATRTREWLELEAAAIAHLAETEFPAVRQRRTLEGEPFIEHEGRFWAAFDFVDGRPADPPSDRQVAALGRLHGELHTALARVPAADQHADYAASFRPRKSWAYLVPLAATGRFIDEIDLTARLAAAGDRPELAAVLEHMASCRERTEAALADLPELAEQLTHYDFGQCNVLFGASGEATVIDFDLLIWDSPAADVARAINAVGRFGSMGPLLPVKAAKYLAAYHATRPLDAESIAALPALLRLYVLQQPIFHTLMYLEADDPAWQSRWAQAIAKDLSRDEELNRIGNDWIAAALGR